MVLAESYARIAWQNLVNFGILPLNFQNPSDYEDIEQGDVLKVTNLHSSLPESNEVPVENVTKGETYDAEHSLSDRQIDVLFEGGFINLKKKELQNGE
jgi:aconitate hydratase